MNRRVSKKMGITIIVLSLMILLSSGYLLVKVLLWNGYNEATNLENKLHSEMQKLKKDPDDIKARTVLMEGFYQKKKYKEVKSQAEYILAHQKKSSDEKVKALYYRSLISGREGNYQEASRDLQEILQINDQFGEAWLSLARLNLAIGDLSAAEKANERAVALLGEEAEPMYIKGQIHYLNGNVEVAVKALKRVIQLNPDHSQAQQLLKEAAS